MSNARSRAWDESLLDDDPRRPVIRHRVLLGFEPWTAEAPLQAAEAQESQPLAAAPWPRQDTALGIHERWLPRGANIGFADILSASTNAGAPPIRGIPVSPPFRVADIAGHPQPADIPSAPRPPLPDSSPEESQPGVGALWPPEAPAAERGPHDDLEAYVLGALDAEERVEFGEHLADCEACLSELRALRHVVDMLPYGLPLELPAAGLRDRLLARAMSEVASPSPAAPPPSVDDVAPPASNAHPPATHAHPPAVDAAADTPPSTLDLIPGAAPDVAASETAGSLPDALPDASTDGPADYRAAPATDEMPPASAPDKTPPAPATSGVLAASTVDAGLLTPTPALPTTDAAAAGAGGAATQAEPASEPSPAPPAEGRGSRSRLSRVAPSEMLATALTPIPTRRRRAARAPGLPIAGRRIRLATIVWGMALLFVLSTGLMVAVWTATAPHPSVELAVRARLPGGRLLTLKGTGVPTASAHLYIVDDGRRAELAVHDLPPLPQGRVYQLWFVEGEQSVQTAGSLYVNARGDTVARLSVPVPVERVTAVAITEEPAPFSPAPTGTHLLAWTP